jgi:electron transfer flavoprotein alpha subunit
MAMELFTYLVHKNGNLEDSAAELAVAASKILPGTAATAVLTGQGAALDNACQAATALFAKVIKVDQAALAYPNAEVVRKVLVAVVPKGSLVLAAHDTFGMDLAPGLSIKLDAAFVADVTGIDGLDGTTLKVVRQEFGGMVSTHVHVNVAGGAVVTVRAGTFQPPEGGLPAAAGQVTDRSADCGDLSAGRRFLEVVQAEVGDVDITKSEVLVSVGRGIEDQENIGIAQELAEAMGADLSCSRPIVDAKWMEKSRQVGTSGQTVKPKVYLALGISGSFQHMGGLKGSPFIVAVNKNPKAPIFQVADVGVVANVLEFVPALTERVKEGK